MAYIGNTVENQGFTPAIDYFNGNGVTVTFTLSRPIASVAQVIVAIDNVIQNPSSSFTVAGNAITFSSAPLSGTNNIWVEYTSLITTYQGISQDPTVIGDIRATGGYLAEGDFGNSFVAGAILDYVTGLGRITVGSAEGIALYNGGTSGRVALASWNASGTLTNTGGAVIQGLTVGKGANAVLGNTVVGNNALASGSQSGTYGVAIGTNALAANTSGGNNVGVGTNALTSNTTGANNIAIGRDAAQTNTMGSNNTVVGGSALQSNTTASNNTAVGYQAGYSNTTGVHNTFMGYQAGYSASATNYNTFIGNIAGNLYTGSINDQCVFIGNSAGSSQTSGGACTYVGPSAGTSMTTGAKNTILGGYSGNQGGLDIRTASNNIVLSDGDGNPRWRCDSTGQEFTLIVGVGLYAAYSCRAWANFAGSNGAVSGSGNISSVSRTGTGLYQVNFSTAMPDANYSVCTAVKPTSGQGSTNGKVANIRYDNSLSVNFFVIYTYSNAGAEDFDRVLFSVFR